MNRTADRWLPYAGLALAFLVAALLRPPIPIDETRYLTVAWEMWLRGDFLVPTVNLERYFNKPPVLFWLIDLAWALFGIGRVQALVPIFAISSLVLWLTGRLAAALFPKREDVAARAPWLAAGSLVFLAYATLVMFDLALTACMLGAGLRLLAWGRGGGLRQAGFAGLWAGVGLLVKGPVILVWLALPFLLRALWAEETCTLEELGRALGLFVLSALAVAALWVVPVTVATNGGFAYELVWEQAAGRVSGSLGSAHARAFYFYLPLLPLFLVPWALSPALWRQGPLARLKRMRAEGERDWALLRFLFLWSLGAVATLSLIAGKQPHYLVPLVPLVAVMLARLLPEAPPAALRLGLAAMLALFAAGHVVAARIVFPAEDLQALAALIRQHRDGEWAFAGPYQGELNFLARMETPFVLLDPAKVAGWLSAPSTKPRFAVVPHAAPEALGKPLLTQAYRHYRIAVFGASAGP